MVEEHILSKRRNMGLAAVICSGVIFGAGVSYSLYSAVRGPYEEMLQKPMKTLEGEVIEEHYQPRTFWDASEYRFSLQTVDDKMVSVKVIDGQQVSKESIDSLIYPKRKVTVQAHDYGNGIYKAFADELFQSDNF